MLFHPSPCLLYCLSSYPEVNITASSMVYAITYKRPRYVDTSRASSRLSETGSISSSNSCPYGVPEALSFDRIISGGTCPVSLLIFLTRVLAWALNSSYYWPLMTVTVLALRDGRALTNTFDLAALHGQRIHDFPHLHRTLRRESTILSMVS